MKSVKLNPVVSVPDKGGIASRVAAINEYGESLQGPRCSSTHVKDGKTRTIRNSQTEVLGAVVSAGFAGYKHFHGNRVQWYSLPPPH